MKKFFRKFVKPRTPTHTGTLNQEVFSQLYQNNIWGKNGDPFYSGTGSHTPVIVDQYVESIIKLTHRFKKKLNAVDLGCGDFNIGSKIRNQFSRYTACDVVPELIEHNQHVFMASRVQWKCLDITRDRLPRGDFCMVRQVLQHLDNEQISVVVQKIQSYRYLLITEHLPGIPFHPNLDKEAGGDIRLHRDPPSGIDLACEPFNLKYICKEVVSEAPEFGGFIRSTFYVTR